MARVTFCLAVILLAASAASAATIHVPADQPTIQAGLTAASSGDTVLVAAGTYSGTGNRDLDFAGKAVVLRSATAPGATTIDAGNAAQCFLFDDGEPAGAVVEGFTIRGGRSALGYGGAFYISGASPTVRDCIVTTCQANTGGAVFLAQSASVFEDCTLTGNAADNWGGAVYAEAGATPTFTRVEFSANMAGHGAGLFLTGGSSASAIDCTFTENAALNLAGAIYCRSSVLALSGCAFEANTSQEGAGIYCLEGSTLTVDECTFTGNLAGYSGGGIWGDSSSLALTRSSFTENMALTRRNPDPRGGGGITWRQAPAIAMSDCVFTGNQAVGGGPGNGQYGGGAYLHSDDPIVIARCEFTGNHAEGAYGGLSVSGEPLRIEDCTFTDNTSDHVCGGLRASGWPRSTVIERCTFMRNHAAIGGGGLYTSGDTLTVADCEFVENTAVQYGGGLYRSTSQRTATIRDCRFAGNWSTQGGGLYLRTGSGPEPMSEPARVERCLFDGNTATIGGGARITAGQVQGEVVLDHLTFVRNGAEFGSGLDVAYELLTISVNNTIIALGTQGAAVNCLQTIPVLTCTDIHGNAGGDWVGCIADQYGLNGCFSEDPLFCDVAGGDFTLAETSPCAAAHSPTGCGLVGALEVGCAAPIGVAAEPAAPVPPLVLRVEPNPVTPEGRIEWTQAADGPAVLHLYDAAGRLVRERALGVRPAGRLTVRWSELVGARSLPSGVYFIEVAGEAGAAVPRPARLLVVR